MGYQHKWFVGCAWAVLALAATTVCAQTHPVTLAWDASPDPTVNGYVVYVGTESGAPAEHFEVSGTSFVYPAAADGRPYFFSVAASSSDHRIGSRSDEVMFFGGGAVMSSSRAAVVASSEPARGENDNRGGAQSAQRNASSPPQFCLRADATRCYAPAVSASNFGDIDSLEALGDGRLIFIESDSRVIIDNPVSNDVVVAATATSDSIRFVSIAVDLEFSTSHRIYVGEIESSADGIARLDIARYRELDGRLGERAVVVAGVPVLRDADVRLAIDGARHLFVALPGALLRYQIDGSIPQDNHAMSPLYAQGVNAPSAIEWDERSNSLWIAERDGAVQRLRLAQDVAEWPRQLEPVAMAIEGGDVDTDVRAIAFSPDASHVFVLAGQPAALFEATQQARTGLRLTSTPLSSVLLDEEPTAAAFNRGELDVAMRSAGGQTRIVRFPQIPSLR